MKKAAYDGPFYRLRSPVMRASEITVPVVIQGGWYDLFQRGEPLLWESLKNSTDRVLIMSPHYHITKGPALEDPNLKQEWFGHWLQGAKNGVQKTPKVNLYSINGTHWEHFKRFPLPKTEYRHLYLSGAVLGLDARVAARRLARRSARRHAEAGDTEPLLPGLEPLLADDRAVDRRHRVQPALRHQQQHLRGDLADLHLGAAHRPPRRSPG